MKYEALTVIIVKSMEEFTCIMPYLISLSEVYNSEMGRKCPYIYQKVPFYLTKVPFYLTKVPFCLTKVPFLIISTLPFFLKNVNTSTAYYRVE